MKKASKDKPAVRPDKDTCAACDLHDICLAAAGHRNYSCPKKKSV